MTLINRRIFTLYAAGFVGFLLAPVLGCGVVSKTTVAMLAQTLGNAIGNLAGLLGNTTIAANVTKYTTQLVADINSYVSGAPTQEIILVIADLEDAINLIPVSPEIQGLIELALGTIQGILAFFPTPAVAAAVQARTKARQVHLAKVPKTSATFRTTWNSLVPASMPGALIP
jgi:hypothetical protein